MAEQYNILSENPESTVVSHYERTRLSEATYQTERELEDTFIAQLVRQGYEHADITTEAQLIANLRRQLERLNDYQFTDKEWDAFFREHIANQGKGIIDKAETIQRDYVKELKCDDGSLRNIYLLRKDNIHANSTQVINQYKADDGTHRNRYDVTILVNGLPLVHVELKRRGVRIREAFNQINRYGRESFWSGNALFEFVQIFIISNGTETKYYSNTTRLNHVKEQNEGSRKRGKKERTSNSFEFTSYWADAENTVINDIEDFTATFLSRHTLLNILTRFCVLTENKRLLVMRPYQIAATERIIMRIETSHNSHRYGTRDAGGYVWHTTGSGKTLTSFKTAQLATGLEYVDKVMFVVDRKDLDYQTIREYDNFEKGAANGNASTSVLVKQINDQSKKIIITTIQKLATFIRKNPVHEFYGKEVVLVFDECHRSQFGAMHQQIVKRFRRYYLFGFTGTPIFNENKVTSANAENTTEDVFGKRLHTYTIVDAIRDGNVLPFRLAYIKTMKEKTDIENAEVWDINQEKALKDPQRITNVTRYILDNFARLTMQRRFNSILAVSDIESARLYYSEFMAQMEQMPECNRLRIATIFSHNDNEQDPAEGDENPDDASGLEETDKEFLERAIGDYNRTFGTNYDTSQGNFSNYYKDLSLRMKNHEIDLLVVVNMFLTGFDATTLNTLWVDKNLRYHGLLQAFSRTNRILNSVKRHGNIVCFRNLERATNNAMGLFGNPEARGVTLLRPFEDYFNGYTDADGKHVKGYKEYVEQLLSMLTPGDKPVGEKAEKDFIALFGTILKMRNLLSSFDQFAAADMLNERDVQDYTSIYLDLADKYRKEHPDKTDINDDIVFEIELVKQVEMNIDYILHLVQQYKGKKGGSQIDLEALIRKAVDSSPDLRNKKDLIDIFIHQFNPGNDVNDDWSNFVNQRKRDEFDQIIKEEHLKEKEAKEFIAKSFRNDFLQELGTEFSSILPPMNPFDKAANRQGKKEAVLERLKAFFEKYHDIADAEF